jgi:hypothetical protein
VIGKLSVHDSFKRATSCRLNTARDKNCLWIRPKEWGNRGVYFEIFQLEKSGDWKVSLIAETNHYNPNSLIALQSAAAFLQVNYGWIPGRNAVFGTFKSVSVYQKEWGYHEIPDASGNFDKAYNAILATLERPDWQAVLSV